jgi:hypothetical protein
MVGYRLLDYDVGMARSGHPPTIPIARFLASAVGIVTLLSAGHAAAQLHGDVSAQVGVMKRFLNERPAGSSENATFGPTAQLTGHVALIPLLHVGAYVGHDISPLSGDAAARNITFAGARVKGFIPWTPAGLRTWVFAGFGYAGVYEQSYHTTFAVPDGLGGTTPTPVRVEGAGGSFFDVPFGLGASYKFFAPWELCGELGFRTGFGHQGSVYSGNGPQVTVPGGGSQNAAPAGLDRFGIGLTVGIQLDL